MAAKKIFFMPHKIGDYITETGHFSPLQHGIYMMLRMHYWMNGCIFPEDIARPLAGHMVGHSWAISPEYFRVCKTQTDEERHMVEEILQTYFPVIGGKRTHADLDAEYLLVKNNKIGLSEGGKRGAKVRWDKVRNAAKNTPQKGDSQVNGQAIPQANGTYTHTLKDKVLTPNPLTVDKPVDNVSKPEDKGFKSFDKVNSEGQQKWDVRHHLTEHTREVLKTIARAKSMDFDFMMEVYNEGMRINGGSRRDVLPNPQMQGAVVNWAKSYAGKKGGG